MARLSLQNCSAFILTQYLAEQLMNELDLARGRDGSTLDTNGVWETQLTVDFGRYANISFA